MENRKGSLWVAGWHVKKEVPGRKSDMSGGPKAGGVWSATSDRKGWR